MPKQTPEERAAIQKERDQNKSRLQDETGWGTDLYETTLGIPTKDSSQQARAEARDDLARYRATEAYKLAYADALFSEKNQYEARVNASGGDYGGDLAGTTRWGASGTGDQQANAAYTRGMAVPENVVQDIEGLSEGNVEFLGEREAKEELLRRAVQGEPMPSMMDKHDAMLGDDGEEDDLVVYEKAVLLPKEKAKVPQKKEKLEPKVKRAPTPTDPSLGPQPTE